MAAISPYTPNEIRRILQDTTEWTEGIEEDNPGKFTNAYLSVIGQIIQEKKRINAGFQNHRQALTVFTYTSGAIGMGSAFGATILYALNKKSGDVEFSDRHATMSFILSVMTGSFIFLAGCGQLLAEYKGYNNRTQKLADEIRLLGILKRFIINAKSSRTDLLAYARSTGYFMSIEEEIFKDAKPD